MDRDILAQIWPVFSAESRDHLLLIGEGVLDVERDPTAVGRLDGVRRAAHNLKGTAASLGLEDIEHLAHAVESALSRVDPEVGLSRPTVVAILDALEALEEAIRRGDEGGEVSVPRAAELLSSLSAPGAPVGAPPASREPPRPSSARPAAPVPSPGAGDQAIRVLAGTVESLARRIEVFLPALGRAGRRGRAMISMEASLHVVLAEIRGLAAGASGGSDGALDGVIERLAAAAADVGNLGRDAVREAEAQRLTAASIREDLRDLRMVPVSSALEPLRRVALDAAVRLGKEVELTVAGEAVKLDRRILNELRDPLVHLVRNAVDHGIERPEARRAAGKRPAGRISVRVEPRGNRVGIVVEDDGAGLDVERVRQAAVRKGATTEAAAAAMNEREAARLVFLPGLSTAAEVTALSGRGVGLDVVHDAVLRLRGKIEVGFERGRGTRFDLDLPLTIATTVGLLVRIHRDLAVLPSESVERVLAIRPGDVGTVAGASTVVVEGCQIAFADLGQMLGVRAGASSVARPAVVLAVGTERAALALDELIGQEEVVVSALGSRVARVAHLAGAALLDDGRVVAVLDPAELVRRARPAAAAAVRTAARARILVTDDSFTTRTAVKSLLEVAGYEVLAAEDGQAALELLRQTRCDVVVSDVQMPRLDGLGLARAVKGDPRLAATPVILVTSLGSSEDRAAGLAAGADGYLVKKDVQGGKLLELVQQLLPARA
jgi:two-component system chemotaxis sensor kinase CheA